MPLTFDGGVLAGDRTARQRLPEPLLRARPPSGRGDLRPPPEANAVWRHDAGDVVGPNWAGQTTIGRSAAMECDPDEWLLVEAWDES
jgi:hypothetical protein